MRPLDSYDAVVLTADLLCCVLGRGEEFTLVRLGGEALEYDAESARQKGFAFCGVIGLANGRRLVRYEPDADSIGVMMLASMEFARQYAHLLAPEAKGDAVDWLGKLMAIPDTRPN